jgi:DNA-binding NarL/FixJ family response regulator
VLVVDDHPDVRFLIRAIIADAEGDAEVAGEADGAAAALAVIDDVDPDVVILDARMPRVDGFEAAAMILARRPDQAILLCTAWVDDEVRRRAVLAGIQACVSKEHFDAIPALVSELAGPPAAR